jgi:hypothetical protein
MLIESTTFISIRIGENYQQSKLCVNNNLPNRPCILEKISCTFVNFWLKFPFHKKKWPLSYKIKRN